MFSNSSLSVLPQGLRKINIHNINAYRAQCPTRNSIKKCYNLSSSLTAPIFRTDNVLLTNNASVKRSALLRVRKGITQVLVRQVESFNNVTVVRNCLNVARTYPITFGAVVTSIKSCLADLLVQTQIEDKRLHELDWKRLGLFATFGFIYQGWFQYYFYVRFMGQFLWPRAGQFAQLTFREKLKNPHGFRDVAGQIAFDQLLYMPFCWFPCFYLFRETLMGASGTDFSERISNAFTEYKDHFKDDVSTSWKIWIPCNFINFAFAPLWARIPFMAGCSFAFCVVISLTTGKRTVRQKREGFGHDFFDERAMREVNLEHSM